MSAQSKHTHIWDTCMITGSAPHKDVIILESPIVSQQTFHPSSPSCSLGGSPIQSLSFIAWMVWFTAGKAAEDWMSVPKCIEITPYSSSTSPFKQTGRAEAPSSGTPCDASTKETEQSGAGGCLQPAGATICDHMAPRALGCFGCCLGHPRTRFYR